MDRLYNNDIDSPERGEYIQRAFNKNPNEFVLLGWHLANMVKFMNNSNLPRIILKILKNKNIMRGSFII